MRGLPRAGFMLQRAAAHGSLDAAAVSAVVSVAGHRPTRRAVRSSGLTAREEEVLALAAIGRSSTGSSKLHHDVLDPGLMGCQSAAISASLVTVFQFRTVTAVPSVRSQFTLANVAFRLPFGHHR